MDNATLWWILTGLAVAIELMTGTFYLLMLALGLVAGAVAAFAGLALAAQLLIAAVVGGGAVILLRRYRKPGGQLAAGANPDVNLDVGATVQVEAWTADGHAQIKYRGANWEVSALPGEAPSPGAHQIVEVVGSRFIVRKI